MYSVDARNPGGFLQIKQMLHQHKHSIRTAKPVINSLQRPHPHVNSTHKVTKKTYNEYGEIEETYKRIDNLKQGRTDHHMPHTYPLIGKLLDYRHRKSEQMFREHQMNLDRHKTKMTGIATRNTHYKDYEYPGIYRLKSSGEFQKKYSPLSLLSVETTERSDFRSTSRLSRQRASSASGVRGIKSPVNNMGSTSGGPISQFRAIDSSKAKVLATDSSVGELFDEFEGGEPASPTKVKDHEKEKRIKLAINSRTRPNMGNHFYYSSMYSNNFMTRSGNFNEEEDPITMAAARATGTSANRWGIDLNKKVYKFHEVKDQMSTAIREDFELFVQKIKSIRNIRELKKVCTLFMCENPIVEKEDYIWFYKAIVTNNKFINKDAIAAMLTELTKELF